jgi:hypothetical protein
VQHLLGAEGVFEDVGGLGEGLVHVAAPQPKIERDIGALAALEMLEIGKGAGGLELVMHQRLVLGRLDLVEYGGQFLVFRDDFLRRLLGDVRIAGEHDRDRLADIMHLADGEDRLVVEGRSIVGVGDHFAHVVAGVDGEDAGHLARFAHVDRFDAAVCHRAAKYFSMQHAGHLHHMGVFGAAGHLLARFEPRQRAADLSACFHGRGHQGAPLMAARTARAV